MITAFDVYLVMQLDSIGAASATFGLIAAIGGAIATAGFLVWRSDQWSWDKEPLADRQSRFDGYAKTSTRIMIAGLCALAFATFLPSTKTMAAMIVLPALTSDEVVQPVKAEAAEIYDLAKQALRQAAEDKPKKAAEE